MQQNAFCEAPKFAMYPAQGSPPGGWFASDAGGDTRYCKMLGFSFGGVNSTAGEDMRDLEKISTTWHWLIGSQSRAASQCNLLHLELYPLSPIVDDFHEEFFLSHEEADGASCEK